MPSQRAHFGVDSTSSISYSSLLDQQLLFLKVGGFGVEARDSKGVCNGGTTGLGESLAPKAIPRVVCISFTDYRPQMQLMLYLLYYYFIIQLYLLYNPNLSVTMIESVSDTAQRLKRPALVASLPVPGYRAASSELAK